MSRKILEEANRRDVTYEEAMQFCSRFDAQVAWTKIQDENTSGARVILTWNYSSCPLSVVEPKKKAWGETFLEAASRAISEHDKIQADLRKWLEL